MENRGGVGKSVLRKEAWDKVTGAAKYTNDLGAPGLLHAHLVASPYAHAKILAIDAREAWQVSGVRAILSGSDCSVLTGEEIRDRPILAQDKVRYHGEAVAVIVADHQDQAQLAASLVKVDYQPLKVVNSPSEALQPNSPLVHEQLGDYEKEERVYPEPHTNIANRTKIRKGSIQKGFAASEVVVEASYSFPPSDHAAMETRCAIVEILPEGRILVESSTQSPFMIKRLFHTYFQQEQERIIVNVPFVGGAYGGKVPVQLELIAYIASRAVGGRKVKLANSREQDMITSPGHIGLDAKVRFGARRDGKIIAAEILYLFDGGAYSDKAVDISRAGGVDCTGPYQIDHVWCDSLCVYTNHPYATAFRGFGHPELTFAIERTMDQLAKQLNLDQVELRMKNAILPGHTSPTQVRLTPSTIGNLPECISRLTRLLNWEEGQRIELDSRRVLSKGISCIWKNSTIEPNAGGAALLIFNRNGSINLVCGVVEIGTGTKTVLAQLVAERMKMDVSQIHVQFEVNTQNSPEHWKTVASRGTLLSGRAVLEAAEDAIRQLKAIASIVLRVREQDLDLGGGRVFIKSDPVIGIAIKDIAHGYIFPNGNAIGGQIIGRGNYIARHITYLEPETGRGNPGPDWLVGAQGVVVEYDKKDFSYQVIKAISVLDAGKVLNPKLAEGQVMGGMHMGLSFAGREAFLFDANGIVQNPQLRTYHLSRFGDNPEFVVDFVETPHEEAPYGARGIGEHGVIGMPAALANSLSLAAGVELNQLPLIPELIWNTIQKNTL